MTDNKFVFDKAWIIELCIDGKQLASICPLEQNRVFERVGEWVFRIEGVVNLENPKSTNGTEGGK